MTITVYGIKNCDSVKKARKWFEQHNIAYTFHDFRADGIDHKWVADIAEKAGWEVLLNKRGTTYRQLSDDVKANIDEQSALQLMAQNPTLIKRPVVTDGDTVSVGFNASSFEQSYTS